MLPSGDPVQLTHDDTAENEPGFFAGWIPHRLYGRHAQDRNWDTWVVPVLGGEPRLWLPNASGLVWIDKSKLLFSEIKDRASSHGDRDR